MPFLLPLILFDPSKIVVRESSTCGMASRRWATSQAGAGLASASFVPLRLTPCIEPPQLFAHRTGLLTVPTPSIVTVTTSPVLRYCGGLREWPTPAGVPVRIKVPGGRVASCDRNAMRSATGKIMSVVVLSCMTMSLTCVVMLSLWGFGTREAGINSWDSGRNESKLLLRTHWPPLKRSN